MSDTIPAWASAMMEAMNAGFARVNERLDQLGGRLNIIEEQLEIIEGRLDMTANRLDTIDARIVPIVVGHDPTEPR